MSGAPGRAPHWPSRMPRRRARRRREAPSEQRGLAVEVGLGAPPAPVAVEVFDAVDGELEPEHRDQQEAGRRHDEQNEPQAVEPEKMGHDGPGRVRRAQGQDNLDPERGGAHNHGRRVEPEA